MFFYLKLNFSCNFFGIGIAGFRIVFLGREIMEIKVFFEINAQKFAKASPIKIPNEKSGF